MTITSKRAENVSIAALVLSVLFFLLTFLVGKLTGSVAVVALSWQVLAGALVWLVLVILYHQRSLAEQEKLDMVQLASQQASDTIFEGDAHRKQLFAVAQKRLQTLERYFVPAFSIIIAIYQAVMAYFVFIRMSAQGDIVLRKPLQACVFMVIVAFVSFLLSRYATGLSSQKQWRDLRAGSSCLLTTALLAAVLAISLGLNFINYEKAIYYIGWIVPAVIVIMGIEIILNSIMDIYRPRIPGQHARLALDSRLLGVINEPGGILHTFASTIDYQFGFKVSQTWFYRLLEKAILPLFLFSVISLYLLSCVVVVDPGHEAVIERFGSFDRIEKPGMTFKMPYPIDIAYKFPTKLISQVDIGFVEHEDSKEANEPLLWGKQHYSEEYDLLVASVVDVESRSDQSKQGTAPVNIIRAAVPVQYRINDIKAYLYNNENSRDLLEAICYQQLTRFAAGSTIAIDSKDGNTESLLGAGRQKAAIVLTDLIQDAVDSAGLGVEIVFVGLQGVHPPPELAEAYQQVIGAVQKKQAEILTAQANRNNQLTLLAGSITQAEKLYDLATNYRKAKQDGTDQALIDELAAQLDKAFDESQGKVFEILSQAKSYAFEKKTLAKAAGVRFKGQLAAYNASPDVYKKTQRLLMLEEALKNVRKYIVVAEDDNKQIYEVDLTEKINTGMMDMETPGSI